MDEKIGLLVLSRREGECLVLFDSVTKRHIATILIDRFSGTLPGRQVRVAIQAEKNVSIMRDELVVRRGDFCEMRKNRKWKSANFSKW